VKRRVHSEKTTIGRGAVLTAAAAVLFPRVHAVIYQHQAIWQLDREAAILIPAIVVGTLLLFRARRAVPSEAHAGGVILLNNHAKPWPADAPQVAVGPRKGSGSFAPKLEPYHRRFGYVMVTQGGHNQQPLQLINAAVAANRHD